MALIGDVSAWRGRSMVKGLSGDTGVSAEYAQRLSRNEKGVEVVWSCTNGDPRDVRTFIGGVEQPRKPE